MPRVRSIRPRFGRADSVGRVSAADGRAAAMDRDRYLHYLRGRRARLHAVPARGGARAAYGGATGEARGGVAALPPAGDPDRPGLLDGWALSALASHYREHAAIPLEDAGEPQTPAARGGGG